MSLVTAWCATSTDSDLNYLTYAYCGYGNNEGDQCAYPFTYSGEEYYDCAGQDTSTPWSVGNVSNLTE